MAKQRIFIPLNVPSSKNSKVASKKGVFHSPTVRHYLQKLGVKKYHKNEYENYKTRPNLFEQAIKPLRDQSLDIPCKMSFHFIRDSRRKFDFVNAVQIVCDLLVAHQVIEDDNMDYLIPMPLSVDGRWYSVDKEGAGVIIEIEKGEG
jgi:Holliday junction resolvase RusA-like endonuclease